MRMPIIIWRKENGGCPNILCLRGVWQARIGISDAAILLQWVQQIAGLGGKVR